MTNTGQHRDRVTEICCSQCRGNDALRYPACAMCRGKPPPPLPDTCGCCGRPLVACNCLSQYIGGGA